MGEVGVADRFGVGDREHVANCPGTHHCPHPEIGRRVPDRREEGGMMDACSKPGEKANAK